MLLQRLRAHREDLTAAYGAETIAALDSVFTTCARTGEPHYLLMTARRSWPQPPFAARTHDPNRTLHFLSASRCAGLNRSGLVVTAYVSGAVARRARGSAMAG
jgi:hypothetical protein